MTKWERTWKSFFSPYLDDTKLLILKLQNPGYLQPLIFYPSKKLQMTFFLLPYIITFPLSAELPDSYVSFSTFKKNFFVALFFV